MTCALVCLTMVANTTTNKAALRAAENDEQVKRRLEREHRELLEELRALIPGAEVLFGFLIAVRFTGEFAALSALQVRIYYFALVATAVALILFIAPAAHHRVAFREGDKDYVVRKGNREAIAGSAALALAFASALHLVTHLLFGGLAAGVAAGSLMALIAWRWWALAIKRNTLGAPPHPPPDGENRRETSTVP
jgi:hypothetical protein